MPAEPWQSASVYDVATQVRVTSERWDQDRMSVDGLVVFWHSFWNRALRPAPYLINSLGSTKDVQIPSQD